MTTIMLRIRKGIVEFAKDQAGGTTIELLVVFIFFMTFLLMVIESGIYSLRHVMLERGVDVAVRDIRIGRLYHPDSEQLRILLRQRICEAAAIIPDCENQVALEMDVRDPRSWQDLPDVIRCVDRGVVTQPKHTFTNGGNNELVFLRACARIDPFMPGTGLGKAIVEANTSTEADGSYALVALSAYVTEPFQQNTGSN